MINDIRPVQGSNLIIKFADDINLGNKVTNDSEDFKFGNKQDHDVGGNKSHET